MKYFSGINIINIGNQPECRSIYHREFPDYWGIQYNHHGNFRVKIDKAPEKIIDGPCVLLTRPGYLYLYGSPAKETRHHSFICFNGPRIRQYIKGGLLPKKDGQQLFHIAHPDLFYQRFLELKNLMIDIADTSDRAVNLLEGLLLLMHQTEQPNKGSIHLMEPLQQLAEEIRLQPELDWDFHHEAENINISYMHLRRAFKQHVGIPPGKYLQRCRLDKAAEELLSGDPQIGRVAEEAGFADQQYFSRVFKQYFQLTPRQYRKEFGVF